ncbi:MAG: protoporphyrinogen oxidase [Desulfuromonadales bacterium C00003096]|jgi:oxygen-dependent protoporphyrinogen oxidase|nr:MAG: protoporphyrinogen oxidase [Desulfuromonadales bacterium C00003096]
MQVVIIGAGISGLATAFLLQQEARAKGRQLSLTVLEEEAQVGGKIRSLRSDDGYLCEWGPNGFLDGKPATLDLCRQLAVAEELVRSNDNARRRFIYALDRLYQVPENAAAFLRSGLLSPAGKVRMAAEIVIPARRGGGDESLADFCRRRLGRQALDRLVGPMVSGIFAGDPETMSLQSCFPRIHQLEVEYGGLFRAMLRLARQRRADRRSGQAVASASGPAGVLTSFSGGLQQLTDRLQQVLADQVQVSSAVTGLEPAGAKFNLQLADGRQLSADVVVSAVPAYSFASLVKGFDQAMAALLGQIPYASLQVACFGYRRQRIAHNLNGFGYLVARPHAMPLLGTLWDSSIFPQRAPKDCVLLRSMIGGATHHEVVDWDRDRVLAETRAALRQTMGIDAEPDFVQIFRHRQAIPQYLVGHGQRLQDLQQCSARYPGLFFTGNAFFGIGLNDCVSAAQRTATAILSSDRGRPTEEQ